MNQRQIKFRAWSIDEKNWYQPKYIHISGEGKIVADNPNDYVLMQSTELLDKNGKEIYEGDIVRHRIAGNAYIKSVVEWKNGGFHGFFQDKSEIIGNIHETPELLNQ